jgi:hypothetical protein
MPTWLREWFIQYWVEVLFSAIVGTFAATIKRQASKIKNQEAEQQAIKLGIQALLRDRIVQCYNHYMEKGFCPIYAMDNIDALYTQYHALGGNGTVTELVDRLKNMPTEIKKREVN